MVSNNFLLLETTTDEIKNINFNSLQDTIILIYDGPGGQLPEMENIFEPKEVFSTIENHPFEYLVFISRHDNFDPKILAKNLKNLFNAGKPSGVTMFLPYLAPPTNNYRLDGTVKSILLSRIFRNDFLKSLSSSFGPHDLIFNLSLKILNSSLSKDIEVIQVGKPYKWKEVSQEVMRSLDQSLVIVPHKGPIKFLRRCLNHLNNCIYLPRKINLCFDDFRFKLFSSERYFNILKRINVYFNTPLSVGPYLSRHYSILRESARYFFFQDSDDISTKNRFGLQLQQLKKRNLDLIGSHELRIDELNKCVTIARFPINVNKAMLAGGFHPILHPTTLITKKAYLKTKGFSTNLKFGYDTQFVLRAFFFLKMGNVDEFLYVRFRRMNSLTTHPKTQIGSGLRSFLLKKWIIDFRLILNNKLLLDDSSLSVYKHEFPYKMKRFR